MGPNNESFYMGFHGFKFNGRVNIDYLVYKLPDEYSTRDVTVVGAYMSLSGKAEIIIWLASEDPEKLYNSRVWVNEFVKEPYRGRETLFWFGLYESSSYYSGANLGRDAGRVLNSRRLKYLVFYPIKMSPEWYLLPQDERLRIIEEDKSLARRAFIETKAEIRSYTLHAYGLAEWDLIRVYEVDDLAEWVKVAEELRASKLRRWVALESPVVVGINAESYHYY